MLQRLRLRLAAAVVLAAALASLSAREASPGDSAQAPAAESGPAAAAAAESDSAAAPAAVRRTLDAGRVVLSSGGRVRPLPHAFIFPGSERVSAGDSLLTRGFDYDLDYDKGVLFLRADHAADTVSVTYRRVPIALAPKLTLRQPSPDAFAGADSTQPSPGAFAAADSAAPRGPGSGVRSAGARGPSQAAVASAAEPGGSKLSLFGSKTFGIEMGNQRDLAVRQALDLTVRGSVARDVEVLALLSDKDTPLQPEGNTTELEELDKVLVEVRGRGASATLGDISVRFADSEFARVDRKLEGASARGERGGWSAQAAGAVSRGEFRSLEFRGGEGKQGPYLLTGQSGERVVVLAGTEKVWLDGEPLTRGERMDYTIDYSLGEITFTSRRSITSATRLTVDYEYSSEAYRRRFYAVSGGGSAAGGALTVRTTILSESDDRGAPRQASLSEEDRAVLREAGDVLEDEGAAVYVGTGGDYRLVVPAGGEGEAASRGESAAYFDYAGEGLGEYQVRFRRASGGAYRDSVLTGGKTIYRYVGTGSGAFEPGRSLSLPESRSVSDVTMRYRPGPGLDVAVEGALSRNDRNTFSSLEDGDNTGRALHLRAESTSPPVSVGGRTLGVVRARASVRQVDSRFRSLGRLEQGFSNETWNAAAAGFGADRRYEGGFDYLPSSSLRLYAEGGRLDAAGDFRSLRRAFGVESSGRVRVTARSERADAERAGSRGSRLADRAEASAKIGIWTPTVHARRERSVAAGDTTGSGNGFGEVGGGVRIALGAPLELEAGLERRRDETRSSGSWRESGRSLAQRYGFRVTRWHALTAAGLFTHSRYDGRGGAPTMRTDLGQLSLLHDARSGGLVHEANVEVTTTDVARRSREIVFVGEGLGHYDELGRFVGSGADYEVRVGEVVGSDLTSRVDATLRSEIRPERFVNARSPAGIWFARFRSGTQLRFSESSDRSAGHVFRSPSSFDANTVTGSFLWRQEIEFLPSGRVFSLLGRHETEERRDRQFTNVANDRSRREETLRARSAALRAATLELEQRWRREEDRTTLYAGGADERSVLRTNQTAATVGYSPFPSLRAQVAGSFATETFEGAAGENRVWEGGPSIGYSFGAKGRFEGRMKWTEVDGGLDVRRFLPVSATAGREGMEWSALFDYRLGARVNALVSADGREPKEGRSMTTARVEMRATF